MRCDTGSVAILYCAGNLPKSLISFNMDRRVFRSRTVQLATFVACVLACLSGCRRDERVQLGVQEVYAAQKTRPLHLRLTSLPYLPAPLANRDALRPDINISATAYSALSSAKADAQTRAIALLLLKQPGPAAGILRAHAQTESSASAWNNLAAALYQQDREDTDTRLMAEALSAADHALRLAPRMPEAHFNRAAIQIG